MSIEIERFDGDERERWDNLVESSPQGTPFHRYDFVEALAEESGTEAYLLVGFKGQEPVGLFPVYRMERGPFTAAFSPPPNLKVSYHGPALVNFEKLKRRKQQKRHRRFLDACQERIDDFGASYTNVRTGSRYDDARPFIWNDYEAQPLYTYVVDLTPGADDLLARFSRDARQNVTRETDHDVDIYEGDADDARTIMEQVRARHAEQGEPFRVTPEFVASLHERLPEGTLRPYVCAVDGEYVGGVVAVELGDTVYRWLGGTKVDSPVAVNDRLDWHIMLDAIDHGLTRYDLVGATTPRIARYKSKYAPDLEEYYQLQRSSRGMTVATRLYKRWLR